MMRRRNKRRVIKWLLWVFGVLGSVLLALALIKIDDVVVAQGIAEPGQKIYIDSPMSRVIERIIAEPGDTVKAGDPVAQLYDGDLRAEVAAAEKEIKREEANLESARARLAMLREKPTPEELKIAESRLDQARITLTSREQELKRAEHLYLGERLWSREEHERALTNYELAQVTLKVAAETLNMVRLGPSPAEVQHAEAAVRQSEAALAKAHQHFDASQAALKRATLRSYADGVVARKDLYPGMQANQGAIVMIIAGAAEGMVINAWMPETNAWKVRLGQPVEILSNLFTDREHFMGYGEVSEVYGYAVHEGSVRTFGLEVAVKETPIPLRYGSTADLRIIVGRRSILKILLNLENRDMVNASRESSAQHQKIRPAEYPLIEQVPSDTTGN